MAIDTTTIVAPAGSGNVPIGQAASSKQFAWADIAGWRQPGTADRLFFTEQLSLMLETGISLHPALTSIGNQISHPVMKSIVQGLAASVEEGRTFSQSLAAYPRVFSQTYVNLVAAAETGGFLHRVLLELVRMEEKRESLRRSISGALSYPGFLAAFSVAVVVFVLVAVFPRFSELFTSVADELPVTTIVFMAASNLLLNHWDVLLVGLTASVGALVVMVRRPQGKHFIDALKLKVFVLRHIFIQVYLIQSLRVLGLSLANGVSLADALASCREVVENRVFQAFLRRLEKNVNEGSGFAVGFTEASFIPPTVKQMVATGDETGNLSTVLLRVADYYERELEKRLASFARMIEPVMLVVMGGVVGLIVSSLILPIFKVSGSVG